MPNEWNQIECRIAEEITFLKANISPSPYQQNDPIKCEACLFRAIAVRIVSGQIKIKKVMFGKNIWGENNMREADRNEKSHGSHWHNSTIKRIENYFAVNNFVVQHEPPLNFGRADTGIEKLSLFFEIGTINLYKLYQNIYNMSDCSIIIIPNDEYFIEIDL